MARLSRAWRAMLCFGLTAMGRYCPNWRAMLEGGLEAGGLDDDGEAVFEMIEARLRTRRPLAAEEWIEEQELVTGVQMQRRKPGPKPRGGGGNAN